MLANIGFGGLLLISLFLIVPIGVVVFIVVMVNNSNRRGKENLSLQKQKVEEDSLLREEVTHLRQRVADLEKLLKEVD